jgi:hypothetical protein
VDDVGADLGDLSIRGGTPLVSGDGVVEKIAELCFQLVALSDEVGKTGAESVVVRAKAVVRGAEGGVLLESVDGVVAELLRLRKRLVAFGGERREASLGALGGRAEAGGSDVGVLELPLEKVRATAAWLGQCLARRMRVAELTGCEQSRPPFGRADPGAR